MNNQKGLSLIEVLGSIVLLGVAILSITFVLQQSTVHTKDNQKQDQSVQITRTVMEEIKHNLRTSYTASIYEQVVNFKLATNKIQYPKVNPEYNITIDLSVPTLNTVTIPKKSGDLKYDLKNIFKHVKVTCTNSITGKQFVLEAFVEYKYI
ncbi:prepilin-type N-terminal cleavage/methylation domain-containing protein [Paenibacillus sp. GSMTC-2017]|nr:prepilin-type N-terminal cleavage/methylation domain-containing protein [Paenibacillus sp. GSMTC-2017]